MNCQYCKTSNPSGVRFCIECGGEFVGPNLEKVIEVPPLTSSPTQISSKTLSSAGDFQYQKVGTPATPSDQSGQVFILGLIALLLSLGVLMLILSMPGDDDSLGASILCGIPPGTIALISIIIYNSNPSKILYSETQLSKRKDGLKMSCSAFIVLFISAVIGISRAM